MASPPFVQLSEGAIQEILDEGCPRNPMVKILSIKKITTQNEQYRAEIYDGRQSAKCMLSNTLNSKVRNLREQSVVSLDKYALMIINHRRFIFILQLSTLDEPISESTSPSQSYPTTSTMTPTQSYPTTPSKTPTMSPTMSPTQSYPTTPSKTPTMSPTMTPTQSFPMSPTQSYPTTPSKTPTMSPTQSYTTTPSKTPTMSPTQSYTTTPSKTPTMSPTQSYPTTPSKTPTMSPTQSYTTTPSKTPTMSPTQSYPTTPSKTPTQSYPSTPSRPIQRVSNRRNSSCLPVAELKPSQSWWTIHATVTAVRELREFNTSRSGKVFSVHLTDESGTIKAAGFDEDAERLFPLLKINQVYFVSNGRVRTANKRYSSLNNNYEIIFSRQTEVKKCHDGWNS